MSNAELSTQPYRTIEELLDKIITIPEDLKKNLAETFEKRRIEMLEKKEAEKLEETQESDEPTSETSTEEKPTPTEENPTPTEEKKSVFDTIFSGIQGSTLLEKISQPKLLTQPQHKCVIRGW
jgi:hypothetical protein